MRAAVIPAATFSVLIIFSEGKFLLCFSVNRKWIKTRMSVWLNMDQSNGANRFHKDSFSNPC